MHRSTLQVVAILLAGALVPAARTAGATPAGESGGAPVRSRSRRPSAGGGQHARCAGGRAPNERGRGPPGPGACRAAAVALGHGLLAGAHLLLQGDGLLVPEYPRLLHPGPARSRGSGGRAPARLAIPRRRRLVDADALRRAGRGREPRRGERRRRDRGAGGRRRLRAGRAGGGRGVGARSRPRPRAPAHLAGRRPDEGGNRRPHRRHPLAHAGGGGAWRAARGAEPGGPGLDRTGARAGARPGHALHPE